MSSAALTPRITPEQYLAAERKASVRSEYYNGEVFAMAGASREHNLIASNLCRILGDKLRDRPCEVYVSDMRVCVSETGPYTYPDVVVVCEEPQFLDRHVDTLLNPNVIIEVLSPSTEADDRGAKFAHFRRLASLHEYVLIAQDQPLVERFTRQDEQWGLVDFRGLDQVVQLQSIGCELPLAEIYAKVRLPIIEGEGNG